MAALPSSSTPLVTLERVVARDTAGTRRRPRGRLSGLTATFGPGIHAIIGTPEDGSLALADVLAGRSAPSSGRVRIAGQDPARKAVIRARIGTLAPMADLPDQLSVKSAIDLGLAAHDISGDHTALALLLPLGLGSLVRRRVASLSHAQARAVELAIALATPKPLLLVLFEPFADVAISDVALVRHGLRALADAGSCVVVLTSSPADARSVADTIHLLQGGVIARTEIHTAGSQASAEAELVVVVQEPDDAAHAGRTLAATLTRSSALQAVAWERHREQPRLSILRVRTSDREQASLAILDAAVEVGAVLVSISSAVPSLQTLRWAMMTRPQQSIAVPMQQAQQAPPIPFGAPTSATVAAAPPHEGEPQ